MATCNDCVHVEACFRKAKIIIDGINHAAQFAEKFTNEKIKVGCCKHENICELFCDRSRFVEFPCKVGDSVFTIDKKGNIQECIVINVNCKTQMMLDEKPWIDFVIVTEPVDDSPPFPMIFTYSITKNQILFLTKESAEQALKERKKKR